jgi:putative membrane protein
MLEVIMNKTLLLGAVAALTVTVSFAPVSYARNNGDDNVITRDTTSKETPALQNFVQKVAISNQFEIDSSELALDKAQSDEVKAFARQMIADHTKAGEDFQTALSDAEIDPTLAPKTLDNKHQQMMDRLEDASDEAFDAAYIQAQTQAHQEAVALFRNFSKTGPEGELKDFATRTLPTLEKHLEHVKGLKGSAASDASTKEE